MQHSRFGALGSFLSVVALTLIIVGLVQSASAEQRENLPAISNSTKKPNAPAAKPAQNPHVLNSRLTRLQAWELAARAVYQDSSASLQTLQSEAARGDPQAEYGMGEYYGFQADKLTAQRAQRFSSSNVRTLTAHPLWDDLMKATDPSQWENTQKTLKALEKRTPQEIQIDQQIESAVRSALEWWKKASPREKAATAEIAQEYMGEISIILPALNVTSGTDTIGGDALRQLTVPACKSLRALLDQAMSNPQPSAHAAFIANALPSFMRNYRSRGMDTVVRAIEGTGCDPASPLPDDELFRRSWASLASEVGGQMEPKMETGALLAWNQFVASGETERADYWHRRARDILAQEAAVGFPGAAEQLACANATPDEFLRCMHGTSR